MECGVRVAETLGVQQAWDRAATPGNRSPALPSERVAHPQLRLPPAPQVVAGEVVAGEPGAGRRVEAVDVAAGGGVDARPDGLEVLEEGELQQAVPGVERVDQVPDVEEELDLVLGPRGKSTPRRKSSA